MKAPRYSLALFIVCLPAGVLAADDTDAKAGPKPDAPKDAPADAAKDKAAKSAPTPPPAAATDGTADKNGKTAAPTPASASAQKDSTGKDSAAKSPAPKPPAETPTVLPQVEVKRNRLIESDRQIMDLEDEIAQEKKKMKPTESDKALNDSRVSSAAAVFGGSSADSRAALAAQRVSLMEAELSLLELSSASKTKAEKDDYLKQAADLRAMRRDLDRGAK
jgi:hypothetical protein